MTIAASPERLERVQNIVVLMKENHSYDNYFGMLERGTASRWAQTVNQPTATRTHQGLQSGFTTSRYLSTPPSR